MSKQRSSACKVHNTHFFETTPKRLHSVYTTKNFKENLICCCKKMSVIRLTYSCHGMKQKIQANMSTALYGYSVELESFQVKAIKRIQLQRGKVRSCTGQQQVSACSRGASALFLQTAPGLAAAPPLLPSALRHKQETTQQCLQAEARMHKHASSSLSAPANLNLLFWHGLLYFGIPQQRTSCPYTAFLCCVPRLQLCFSSKSSWW